METVECFKCKNQVPLEGTTAWGRNGRRVCTGWFLEYKRVVAANYRKRHRPEGYKPRQVYKHSQLSCTGQEHICTGCEKLKKVEEFPKNSETPCGHDPRCKECRHQARVQRRGENKNDILIKEKTTWRLPRYGITYDQFQTMLRDQGGACYLCEEVKEKTLCVDHDHRCCPGSRSCGKCVRGLLCSNCNKLVGYAEQSIKLIDKLGLAAYVSRRPLEA